MFAIPTARVGAPPVREIIVTLANFLGGLARSARAWSLKPQPVTAVAALSNVVPISAPD